MAFSLFGSGDLQAQEAAVSAQQGPVPPQIDPRIYDIISAASPERVEADVRALAGFGTRNTFSDTLSATRGIGAARRWIKQEFDEISADCGGCLEVFFHESVVPASRRVPNETGIVNVVAIQRGTVYPNRYVLMAGDIDSRASGGNDAETDAPGANDNATGMAGAMEAARLLTKYSFPTSIIYVGLSGEEQGLLGGRALAETALEEGWEITAVLNNDMIGNTVGDDGIKDNTTFRVFSQPVPATDELADHQRRRTRGGEVDGPSRQIARYVDRIADLYFPNLDAKMIYRLDRFGRGGHHRPFNDAGFPGVRIMETHESYIRQHQDIRVEDGIEYGDVVEWVDFDYTAKMTALNAAVLASMAWGPPAPTNVRIGGSNRPSAVLSWDLADHPNLAGYKVYWRDTTAPQWEHYRWAGMVDTHTMENVIIDNYLFGVAAVSKDGNESVVVFPGN
ncbi:MAG: M28 family peptidase [Gemmatimonadetes bacterium]|nr:M28 family peptidase [Gemmatimonadota bacterium]